MFNSYVINHHLLFYFKNPDRTEFRSDYEQIAYNAVADVLASRTWFDLNIIKTIICAGRPYPESIAELASTFNTSKTAIYNILFLASQEISDSIKRRCYDGQACETNSAELRGNG